MKNILRRGLSNSDTGSQFIFFPVSSRLGHKNADRSTLVSRITLIRHAPAFGVPNSGDGDRDNTVHGRSPWDC